MKINYCFPTVILSLVDETLADKLLPSAQKYLNDEGYINKNITLYKNTLKLDKTGYKEFEFFSDYICNLSVEFLLKHGCKTKSENLVVSFFLNEMYDISGHPPHSHPNHILSGVIYLQTPIGSAPIQFHDPKPTANLIRRETQFETDLNVKTISVPAQKGLLLMWESWLEHSVGKNTNKDSGRISLVFNVSFVK